MIMIFQQTLWNRIRQSSLARDSFWALFGNIVNKGLALLAGIVIARFLGKEQYGEYGMIKNTLLYIAVFSTFGLGFTSTRFVAQLKDQAKERLHSVITKSIIITLVFSGMMAAGVFAFSSRIADYLEAPGLSLILKYTAVTVVFNALTATQIGILAGLHRFKETARNNFIVGVITFLSGVVLTYYYGLDGAIIALMIANGFNCILNYATIKNTVGKSYPRSTIKEKRMFRELLSFSLPIAMQESLFSVQYLIGTVMLVKLSNYGELGLYNAAGQWAAAILFIPSALQNVALSHLSETALDKSAHYSTFMTMIKINLISTIIPFICIAALSGVIVSLYGADYAGLRVVLIAAVSQTIIYCLLQVYFQEFIALGRNWMIFTVRFVRDVLSLLLAYILLKMFDNNGALLFSIAHIVFNGLTLIVLWRLVALWNRPSTPRHKVQ